ncbi:MAG: DUF5615 family PIN-like protein [Dehalococcoidia bacterium]|nr:DUF5615 family PIN-like protein [Dehalococcoidia bacterium]
MRARLYFDENFALGALITAIVQAGVDCVRAVDCDTEEWPDEAQLGFAAERGLVVVTADRADFLRIHSRWIGSGRSHAGIIIITQGRYSIGELIRRMLRLLDAVPAKEFADRVEFLSNWE